MTYKKIGPDHPSYKMVMHLLSKGMFCCDAEDHNEDSGCSNPKCWKYTKRPTRRKGDK